MLYMPVCTNCWISSALKLKFPFEEQDRVAKSQIWRAMTQYSVPVHDGLMTYATIPVLWSKGSTWNVSGCRKRLFTFWFVTTDPALLSHHLSSQVILSGSVWPSPPFNSMFSPWASSMEMCTWWWLCSRERTKPSGSIWSHIDVQKEITLNGAFKAKCFDLIFFYLISYRCLYGSFTLDNPSLSNSSFMVELLCSSSPALN